MKTFDVQDLVNLFYHPRMGNLLERDFQDKLQKWQKELKAENSTALGQILSHYPTVMLVGPAQCGKTSIVSGLLNFEDGQRALWINKHAGTGAVSKTKVPTRYVNKTADPLTEIGLQPEMAREIQRVFEDILVHGPEKLEEDDDETEKATTKIIMANTRHPVRPTLIKDRAFSVLDMPGTAACGSNLEELFSGTQKRKHRIYNLVKERYLLYRIFPDVAQILVVVAPLQNLGAAKWAQEDVIDKYLSKHLQEPCSLRGIMKKYHHRTILCIPDLNKWNRRENWKEEYWQSLESLIDQFDLTNWENIAFIRAPEIDDAYESLYDSVFADLIQDSPFRELLAKQKDGFIDRKNRGFDYLSERVWESLKKAQDISSLRNTIISECTEKLTTLGLCQKNGNIAEVRKLLPVDEIELLNGSSSGANQALEILKIETLDLQSQYSSLYRKVASQPPGDLYRLIQKVLDALESIPTPPSTPLLKSPKNHIILLDEKEWGDGEWRELKRIWQKSDFPLCHFSDQDFQEAHRILLYQSTLGSKKKILYPYRIQPVPTNEKARFLVRPTSFSREEDPLEDLEVEAEGDAPSFPLEMVSLPFVFDSAGSVWQKKGVANFLILFHQTPPESFLLPGRYHYLKEQKLLRSYSLEEVLAKFKKQELTLGEIFLSLGIDQNSSLIWIEYHPGKALLC